MAWKILWEFFESSCSSYEPPIKTLIRIRPVPAGCRRASVAPGQRECGAHAQSLRPVFGASRTSWTSAGKRRIDEVGLARYLCRGSKPLLQHLAHPQGAGRWGEWAEVYRDCAEARLPLCGW